MADAEDITDTSMLLPAGLLWISIPLYHHSWPTQVVDAEDIMGPSMLLLAGVHKPLTAIRELPDIIHNVKGPLLVSFCHRLGAYIQYLCG